MKDEQGTIAAICDRLSQVFNRDVPHGPMPPGRKRKSVKDLSASVSAGLVKFYEAARCEREKYRLGIVGRARVAFGLQQRLLEAGHPPVLVKQVLFAMLLSAFAGNRKREG